MAASGFFDEIVGQKHNVQTLKNVLDGKRLSHSYIFCGPRGYRQDFHCKNTG